MHSLLPFSVSSTSAERDGGGRRGRPAAFLDRDGTLMVDRGYVSDPADVALLPGVAAALRRLAEAGFALVVVTNQSGIARGYYGEADFEAVESRLESLLAEAGVHLDGVYHCPHHPDIDGPCACRKPGLGLFQQAARELGLDPARSVFIGDKATDLEPALALGGQAWLVLTGQGAAQLARVGRGARVAEDLPAAVDALLGRDTD